MGRKIILDCDPGHDDAIAMILAASRISNLQIEAITTVAGNVEVEKNTKNALKVCDIIGLQDVPVAQGADRPLVKEREIAEEIHGETGLDGPNLPKEPKKQAMEQHAVDVIIEKVMQSEEAITLVPTGPLTNIALAMIKEPRIIPKIREIVLMGGRHIRQLDTCCRIQYLGGCRSGQSSIYQRCAYYNVWSRCDTPSHRNGSYRSRFSRNR